MSLAISVISVIFIPLHVILLHRYEKQDKKIEKDLRIAGNFRMISDQLDEEYHRQVTFVSKRGARS
jgi:hypothetical protein